jgi:hypothetical protein
MVHHEIIPKLDFEIFIQYKNADINPLEDVFGQARTIRAFAHKGGGGLKRSDKFVNNATDLFDAVFRHEHGEMRYKIAVFDREINF